MASTSPLRLHALPLDILIDLLKSLPSFTYLSPLIRTHRAFNEVWKENFNEISQAIAHHEFEPWEDAVKLMLEQLHPIPGVMPTLETPMRLSKEDLAQMRSNARYLNILEKKHNEKVKDVWRGPPISDSETELLRFRRATYRAWLFNLTMEDPKCTSMCDVLSLIELTEMQLAGKNFVGLAGWPGLPDFSVYPAGYVVQSLEGVIRPRIANYVACDSEVDLDDVHDLKRHYASLKLQDPSVKGEDFLEKVEKLMGFEKRWRENMSEEKKVDE